MTRTATLLAAGLLAAAGLAAPASAQNLTTTISSSDGHVQGNTIKTVDGVKYKVEFNEDGPTAAYIDGLEVEFKHQDGTVLIADGGKIVEVEMPAVGRDLRTGMFFEGAGAGRGLARLPDVDEPFAGFNVRVNQPKTMVGLTQSTIDDQLREHLDLEEGVGTMILSVIEGLPADKAGLKHGDVLIEVNGRKVTGAAVLTEELADLEPGAELGVTVLRKGLPETLTIEVAKFDAEKLYGERNTVVGIGEQRFPGVTRWRFNDDGFDFDNFENQIREELGDIKELNPEQQAELDRAMAEAREQIARAMEQAKQIRGLQWDGDLDLLLRPRDKERAIVIEGQAQRERVEAERHKLAAEADVLRARNRELESRLEALESRLDRLIDLLEEQDEE